MPRTCEQAALRLALNSLNLQVNTDDSRNPMEAVCMNYLHCSSAGNASVLQWATGIDSPKKHRFLQHGPFDSLALEVS